MKTYADTAFLVSVHCRDANTGRALARMKTQLFPIAWTWLSELEFRNAMRLRVFRGEMVDGEVAQVFDKVKIRTEQGIYRLAAPALSHVAREAERLSELYTAGLGNRSLDILHVAHALVLGVKEFLTFDARQGALAKAAGLKVPKL